MRSNSRLPLVSIIIPVYNGGKTIIRCVNSIVNQSYPMIEIIIVNDGSTDDTASKCEIMAKKYRRTLIINQKNSGVSGARNVGIGRANGKYIMFVDSDDVIKKHHIEKCVHIAEKNDVEIVISPYIKRVGLFRKKYKFSSQTDRVYTKKYYKKDVYLHMLTTYDFSSVAGVLINGELARRKTFKPLSYGEDFLYMSSIIAASDSLYISNQAGYIYIINKASAIHTFDAKKKEEEIRMAVTVYAEIARMAGLGNDQIIYRLRDTITAMLMNCAHSCAEDEYESFISAIEAILRKEGIKFLLNCQDYGYWRMKKTERIKRLIIRAMG